MMMVMEQARASLLPFHGRRACPELVEGCLVADEADEGNPRPDISLIRRASRATFSRKLEKDS
jgi:hypothetical protein